MSRYKVQNWSKYNESLKNRGSLSLWISEAAIKLWKKLVGYHKRSLVETAFSRFKGIFGGKLFSKDIDNQGLELNLKAYVLNKMSQQGMPLGVMI